MAIKLMETSKKLEQIVGGDWVIKERERIGGYLVDETPDHVRPEPATNVILVKPANAEEISEIAKYANDLKIPIFPRGGGTGLVGGCIPTEPGIVLSLERMDKIEIDKENMIAVAEAGVTLEKLIRSADGANLFFSLHPGDEGAQIGGLVACNAGGTRAVKYGILRNHVKGIEAVLPTGGIISFGGKLLKNNTGYDIMHLLMGSEGTLCIITKVFIRLLSKPQASATLLTPFNDRYEAVNTAPRILQSGLTPLALEYVQKDLIEKSAEHLGEKWPCKEGEVFLIAILTGPDKEDVYSQSEKVSEICIASGSLDPLIAESRKEQETILNIRSNIYTALKPETADILDVTVPPASIGKLMDAIDKIAEKFDTCIPMYGHVADGNLHPHVMVKEGKGSGHVGKVKDEIYKVAIDLGGVITGEHGVGKIRSQNLALCLTEREMRLIKGIKNVFDPNNILNPTKSPIR